MGGDSFRFQLFTVNQAVSAMKVGTDGVILGSWAALTGTERNILDVGTGTGLVAMMVAQRAPGAVVEAVEIDSGAAREAAENFAGSPFADRLSVRSIDFQSFARDRAASQPKFDLIVSNPPYFNGTYKSIDVQRTAARHTELLPSIDLIEGVLRVIDPVVGRFSAIFPYSDAAVFIAKAAGAGLYCSRLLEILPKQSRSAKRMAAEFSVVRPAEVVTEQLIVLNEDGGYTDQFKALTGAFYLKF